ncbi:HAUS augmin-like complex subunit 7 isoform X2 [Hippocampus comes]|uniref:HAUS augmin like complex subunit 7 n=1 Tax=Hippocampus comes TaxID=109280 RepID=A0A3Q2YZZ9_HIPCM|nr:PREDICTED: HAUS augmin-like complex subunit 7 isoform X2 [Hippocampus comes]
MRRRSAHCALLKNMAAVSNEKERAERIYTRLLAVPCPVLEGVCMEESEDILQLLCTPSQLRTDILTWMCCRIDPNFASLKGKASRTQDLDILTNGMAALGQDLLLCRVDSLDLIKGEASCQQQLQFLEKLLAEVSDFSMSTAHDMKMQLNALFADENLHLAQMVTPSLDHCFSNDTVIHKGAKTPKPRRDNSESIATLLQSTRSMLEQLQSEFVTTNEAPNARLFTSRALHVTVCDLQQLMTTFCHVYETHLSVFCTREPPSFSADTLVFQSVYERLQACCMELEMLNEASDASASVKQEVSQLQIKRCCASQGKGTLHDHLEKLTRRIKALLAHLCAANNSLA